MHSPKPVSPLMWVPSAYFTMALGYVMLTSVTAIMFKNLGMDNGLAAQYSSLLILAYTVKPLFAPFVEMYRTKKFFVLCAQVLIGLGFAGVGEVRQGKLIELELDESDREVAKARLSAMCEQLLANPVIESYSVTFDD